MNHENKLQGFDVAEREIQYPRRRVREEANAYAKRRCDAADRAWVAEHRAW
jgi:hypothetical protein